MTSGWDQGEAPDDEEFGPGDPDYDLSEAHGYTWEPPREHWPVPRWLLVLVSVLVIAALVLPALLFIASQR